MIVNNLRFSCQKLYIKEINIRNILKISRCFHYSKLLNSKENVNNVNPDRRIVLNHLSIHSYSDDELNKTYEHIIQGNSSILNNHKELNDRIEIIVKENMSLRMNYDKENEKDIANSIVNIIYTPINTDSKYASDNIVNNNNNGLVIFKQNMKQFGEKIDQRVISVGASFLLTGASIGIIIPCMPLLASQLALSSTDFGLVISSFGLSKLLGNIPSSYYVDKYGRKSTMIGGLLLCSIGLGGISLISTEWGSLALPYLCACRLVSGLGVSGFIAGAFNMMTDVSTPLNRARTLAPVTAAFQTGIALGPAVGGITIDTIGIPYTYLICGSLFSLIALLNKFLLTETLINPKKLLPFTNIPDNKISVYDNYDDFEKKETLYEGICNSYKTAFYSWKSLAKNPKVSEICSLNFSYWIGLAGVQMTILPLYMISPLFSLGATEIGTAFALMSIASVVSSQPIAYIADNYGRTGTIIGGLSLISLSMYSMSIATSYHELLGMLAVLSVGNTSLNSVPIAVIADCTTIKERSQALSLLRTTGDIGLLVGATLAGNLIDSFDMSTAININAMIISGSLGYYVVRQYFTKPKVI